MEEWAILCVRRVEVGFWNLEFLFWHGCGFIPGGLLFVSSSVSYGVGRLRASICVCV